MTSMELPVPGRSAAPTVAYGPGAIRELPRIVGELGGRRLLLVCGRTSFEASGAAEVMPELEQVAEVRRWSDFRPNTDSQDLAVGLEVLQELRPEVVVGVGGGSALDMAKLLVSYAEVPSAEVVSMIEAGTKADSRTAKLILAPTTSGSGAEATHFAVVYVGDEKYSIAGPAMRADAIVLDPALTLSGSNYQRATSGIDAVAQAIESLWAVGATDRSRRFARHALRLLLPAIETYVNEPGEGTARAMAIGSHLAGRAIDISKTTAAHALSYAITKGFGVSHGHAVALALGPLMAVHDDLGGLQLQGDITPQQHARTMSDLCGLLHSRDGEDAAVRFAELMKRIGLTPSAMDLGIEDPEQRRALVAEINPERLSNNPVLLSQLHIEKLLDH